MRKLALLVFLLPACAQVSGGADPAQPGAHFGATPPTQEDPIRPTDNGKDPPPPNVPAPPAPTTPTPDPNAPAPTTPDPTTPDPTAPAPDPNAPAANGLPPELADRVAPPKQSDCVSEDQPAPATSADDAQTLGAGIANKARQAEDTIAWIQAGERHGGLDRAVLRQRSDRAERSTRPLMGRVMAPLKPLAPLVPTRNDSALDSDGDCLSDADEARLGTDPHNPDSDGDGWFDGPCNERRKLILTSVHSIETQDWNLFGGDDVYVVADEVRYPNSNLDDYWNNVHSGDTRTVDTLIAQRTRGVKNVPLAQVTVEGWDDDFELFNTWTADDQLWSFGIDLGAHADGDVFTLHHKGDDWEYEATFKVVIERFADPSPLDANGDTDHDGIKESAEAKVAADFGGVADPERSDVLVEVDFMKGHRLRTEARRQVVTQQFRHGQHLFVWRDEELPVDPCLSVPDAKALYKAHFTNIRYNAFRYAIVGEKIWNNASGVTWGDIFLINDSTWWISDMVLPQAGTFIHELGHTLGLTKDGTFHMIDSISWLSYDSAMNYTFQALLVDYDDEAGGPDDWHHDDWGDVKASTALQFSFALVPSNDLGICK